MLFKILILKTAYLFLNCALVKIRRLTNCFNVLFICTFVFLAQIFVVEI